MERLVFDDTTAPTGGEIRRQSFQFAGTCHPCLRCRGLGKWKLFERVPCLNNSYLRPATASWWLSVPALWDVPEPVGTLASWHNRFDGKRKKPLFLSDTFFSQFLPHLLLLAQKHTHKLGCHFSEVTHPPQGKTWHDHALRGWQNCDTFFLPGEKKMLNEGCAWQHMLKHFTLHVYIMKAFQNNM